MRLYLVNPSNPLISINKINESRWNRYRVWKPLSLMVLAGLTPADWDISIIDENFGLPDYQTLPRPDLVGITAFTSQASRAYEIAAHFQRFGIPVVMGGIHATMCLEEAMEHVDSVATGEAEGIWRQILEDAACGGLKRRYDGELAAANSIPVAKHELLDLRYSQTGRASRGRKEVQSSQRAGLPGLRAAHTAAQHPRCRFIYHGSGRR